MSAQNPSDTLLEDLLQHARPVKGQAADDCFISSAEFAALDVSHEWMIDRTMVRYEPLVLGGPKKSLKTSVVLDLAISLAAGFNSRFLGKFDVERPYRVGIISGESGKPTLQRKAITICKTKGLNLANLPIQWRFRMPRISIDAEQQTLAEHVREHKLEVMIFDPMYLALLAENPHANAGNVLQMGPLLQKVVDTCLPYDCTPILVHHTKKLGPRDGNRPLDLDDLSQSGFAEFARQWILLSRRSLYLDGSGQHELYMKSGGSAGHSSLWGIDIDEGSSNAGMTGERWDVTVRTSIQIKKQKEIEKSEGQKDEANHLVNRVVEHLESTPDGDTKTGIREALKINNKNATKAIELALARGLITAGQVVKKTKSHPAFLIVPSNDGHPDNPDTQDGLECPAVV